LFRTIAGQFRGILQRFLAVQAADDVMTVEQEPKSAIDRTQAMVGMPDKQEAATAGLTPSKRFKRTTQGVALVSTRSTRRRFALALWSSPPT
jgi:hypothetical protein